MRLSLNYVAAATDCDNAILAAQAIANQNGAPVGVLEFRGSSFYAIIEDSDAWDEADRSIWAHYAVVDPQEPA